MSLQDVQTGDSLRILSQPMIQPCSMFPSLHRGNSIVIGMLICLLDVSPLNNKLYEGRHRDYFLDCYIFNDSESADT